MQTRSVKMSGIVAQCTIDPVCSGSGNTNLVTPSLPREITFLKPFLLTHMTSHQNPSDRAGGLHRTYMSQITYNLNAVGLGG